MDNGKIDACFDRYWQKNSEALLTLGVSEKTARVIYFNGMADAAGILTGTVASGMKPLTDNEPKTPAHGLHAAY